MTNVEIKCRRRAFADKTAQSIRTALVQIEHQMWEAAARQAQEDGLYARTTYVGDIVNGLKSHAGMRYGSVVKEQP